MKTGRRDALKLLAVMAAAKGVAWGGQRASQGPVLPGAQSPGIPGMPTPQDPLGRTRADDTEPARAKMEAQQAKIRDLDRQKRLQADTEKLLSLATELKQDVDKTDKNILSVDVIKKADEIERLARSVKDRMKGTA